MNLAAISEPLVMPGSDGNTHVDYDVVVTNVFTSPITLIAVTVRDRATGATVQDPQCTPEEPTGRA